MVIEGSLDGNGLSNGIIQGNFPPAGKLSFLYFSRIFCSIFYAFDAQIIGCFRALFICRTDWWCDDLFFAFGAFDCAARHLKKY